MCAYGKYKWHVSVHVCVCVCVHMLKIKSNKRVQIKENTYVHRVEKDLPCGWHIKVVESNSRVNWFKTRNVRKSFILLKD